ncbi:MAG: hypothetical protein ABH804_02185 [archaeon]
MECNFCGASGERAKLFDVISDSGIVKACEKCVVKEGLPVIRKQEPFYFKEAEKKQTVYERLSRSAGFDREKSEVKPEPDSNLRKIVEKNYKEKQKTVKPKNLVDNFHWIIMRVRRAKKLTQKQLAENIGEPEIAVKLAEQGILPENYFGFVNKIENALGINIFKKDSSPEKPKEIIFDRKNKEYVTIGDLKGMKKSEEIAEQQGHDFEEEEIEDFDKTPEEIESNIGKKRKRRFMDFFR